MRNYFGDASRESPPTTLPKIDYRSALRSFNLGISNHFVSELDILLACCPELISFACNITGSDYYDPISPSLFSQTLSHCRETLSTLDLNHDDSETVDDTSADLSCLDSLKILKASSDFLFDWNARMEPAARKGLYIRLPSSLEILKV